MNHKGFAGAVRLFAIVSTLFSMACSKPAPKAMLPNASEILSVSVVLYQDDGREVISQCEFKDDPTIREILDCLTPSELSEFAAEQLHMPIVGKVGLQRLRGTTWIEFVDAGNNALCFRFDGKAYLRGGAGYKAYRPDHKRLYGLDTEWIDECTGFYRKLLDRCRK